MNWRPADTTYRVNRIQLAVRVLLTSSNRMARTPPPVNIWQRNMTNAKKLSVDTHLYLHNPAGCGLTSPWGFGTSDRHAQMNIDWRVTVWSLASRHKGHCTRVKKKTRKGGRWRSRLRLRTVSTYHHCRGNILKCRIYSSQSIPRR